MYRVHRLENGASPSTATVDPHAASHRGHARLTGHPGRLISTWGRKGHTRRLGDTPTPRLARMRPPCARRGEHYYRGGVPASWNGTVQPAIVHGLHASARLAEEREAAALDAPARRRGRLAAAARVAECGVKDEAGPLEWRSAVVRVEEQRLLVPHVRVVVPGVPLGEANLRGRAAEGPARRVERPPSSVPRRPRAVGANERDLAEICLR